MAKIQMQKEDGLKREFSVTVPKEDVESAKLKVLANIGKQAKLPGFRPGKAPANVIAQRYGQEAYSEAIEKVVSDAIDQTIEEGKLRPAQQPAVEVVSMEEGKGVELKVSLEILPTIAIKSFDSIKLERPTADVDPAKVDEMITTFAKRMRGTDLVEEKRAAKTGDIAVIDYDGSIDGEKRPGMKGEGHHLELGAKTFIDTFEEQLVGCKPGDNKTVSVKFPENYHAADLAGKQAVFEVSIKELRQHKPLNLDDSTAKEMGFPGIDKLRERVRDDMSVDYSRISRSSVKRSLMDLLAKEYNFEVPSGLLELEFKNIWHQVEEAMKSGDLPKEDQGKTEAQLRDEYKSIAERRVRLGLLLAEIATQNKVEVSGNELRSALIAEARRYPGQEKSVFDYYTKTKGAMERIRAPLLEEKVVDFIIGKATVTDKQISAEELLKLPEEE